MTPFRAIIATSLLLRTVWASEPLSPLPSKEETRARKLYLLKCAKCHPFYPPRDYPETEWKHWMDKMRKKSHLSPDEHDLLLNYTLALRAKPNLNP